MKKILILASNPRKDLNLDREIRELKDVIERSRYREEFEVEDALAVRVGDLQELLLQHQPQIVHFCGHGGGQSGLVLEGNAGGEQWVRTDALRDLFRLFSREVQCVLLNACYSDEQADEIVQHIDYVIGMDQEIRDDAAIAFSKGFYRALGYGCEIEEAYAFGCNAIQLELSNRANVRSRSADLTRRADVLQAVNQTVIPEHVKPMLKKRAGQLLANAPKNTGASQLPPAQKEEIQLQIAQAVTAIPDPPPNRSNLPIPQGLLSPAPRRRIAPWLSMVFIGLLPVVGFLIYRAQTAKPPAPPASRQAIVPPAAQPPVTPANKSDLPQSDADLLERAKDLAAQQQWQNAIEALQIIPADSALAKQLPTYLNPWSNRLLDDAKLSYDRGDLVEALAKAQAVPETSNASDAAKRAIANWQPEKDAFDKILSDIEKWDVDTPKQEIQRLKNPVLIQQVTDRISARETDIAAVEAKRQAAWQAYSQGLSEQPLDVQRLEGKSPLELDILRNALYAWYGLKFERSDLQEAFANQPWYRPNERSPSEIEPLFSEQERQNVQTICTFQKEKNLTLVADLPCP